MDFFPNLQMFPDIFFIWGVYYRYKVFIYKGSYLILFLTL